MKGIILAGGSGTRLYPLTQFMSKQLLLVNDKPMIFYPLALLMQMGIKEILIITTQQDAITFQQLLGDGSRFGISLDYAVQHNPEGIAQAFIIGEPFIGDDNVCLILGDNFFYADPLNDPLKKTFLMNRYPVIGATIFGYSVGDPEHYGVAEIDQYHRVIAIEEKPKQPKSNVAITGLYCYDNRVIEFAKQVKPSKRGELEITSINQMYLEREELTLALLSPDISWFDMGTHEKLNSASLFIKQVEDKIGKSLVCLDEIVKTNTGFDDIAANSEQERLDLNMAHPKDETGLILESRLLAVKSHKPIQNKVSMCEY